MPDPGRAVGARMAPVLATPSKARSPLSGKQKHRCAFSIEPTWPPRAVLIAARLLSRALLDLRRDVVFEGLAEIAHVERCPAVWAGHEMLGLALGGLIDSPADMLPAWEPRLHGQPATSARAATIKGAHYPPPHLLPQPYGITPSNLPMPNPGKMGISEIVMLV